MLHVVVVRPHRVQDGEDPPLAEGALGLAFSPPQDAGVAELVEAWHHKAGLLPAFQADGAAVLQLYGHALHLLQWAWGGTADVEVLPLTSAAAAGAVQEKEERPRSLAGPGRGGRKAQVPPEGDPPSSPG